MRAGVAVVVLLAACGSAPAGGHAGGADFHQPQPMARQESALIEEEGLQLTDERISLDLAVPVRPCSLGELMLTDNGLIVAQDFVASRDTVTCYRSDGPLVDNTPVFEQSQGTGGATSDDPAISSSLLARIVSHAEHEFDLRQGAVNVLSVTYAEYASSALGCPGPGRLYLQVITPGHRVVVDAAGTLADYRVEASTGSFKLCSSTSGEQPLATPQPGESPSPRPTLP